MGMGKSFNVDTSAKEANTARNCCRTDKPFVFFRFRSAQLMVDMNDARRACQALKPLDIPNMTIESMPPLTAKGKLVRRH